VKAIRASRGEGGRHVAPRCHDIYAVIKSSLFAARHRFCRASFVVE